MKSYALDAANGKMDVYEKIPECTLAGAQTFFSEALEANVTSSDSEKGMSLTKRDGKHVISFTSSIDSDAAPAAMFGMGGVHFSGFAK